MQCDRKTHGLLKVVACTFALALLALSSPAEAVELTLTLDQDGLTATGVTLGGTVAWFGAWHHRSRGWTKVGLLDERSIDEDSDGDLSLPWPWEAGIELPYAGVFFVVDLTTGDYAITTPNRYPFREIVSTALSLSTDGSELEVSSNSLFMLTVRPGTGSWISRVKDGGPGDLDGSGNDGKVRLGSGQLDSRGRGVAPPATFATQDRLFGIDVEKLEFFVVTPSSGS